MDKEFSGIDFESVSASIDAQGYAILPALLSADEADGVAALYDDEAHFRSHVHMARHGFGQGEYRYFAYPLPPLVADLRAALYARLAGQGGQAWLTGTESALFADMPGPVVRFAISGGRIAVD